MSSITAQWCESWMISNSVPQFHCELLIRILYHREKPFTFDDLLENSDYRPSKVHELHIVEQRMVRRYHLPPNMVRSFDILVKYLRLDILLSMACLEDSTTLQTHDQQLMKHLDTMLFVIDRHDDYKVFLEE